jgi:hypothetical protein
MSTDPIARIPPIFGKLLNKLRRARNIDAAEFTTAARLTSTDKLASLESGQAEPTLTEFFRIAGVLNESPAILLVDLITNWRDQPDFGFLYRPRPGDFTRLFRLGCYELSADFHELVKPYSAISEAMDASKALNTVRERRRQPLLDHITIYVRMGYVRFKPETLAGNGGTPVDKPSPDNGEPKP